MRPEILTVPLPLILPTIVMLELIEETPRSRLASLVTDWHRNRINGRRLGTARPFPLWRLHSGPQSSSFRSMFGNAPRTPESSVADAMRTSVGIRNYRQINSRGYPQFERYRFQISPVT